MMFPNGEEKPTPQTHKSSLQSSVQEERPPPRPDSCSDATADSCLSRCALKCPGVGSPSCSLIPQPSCARCWGTPQGSCREEAVRPARCPVVAASAPAGLRAPLLDFREHQGEFVLVTT